MVNNTDVEKWVKRTRYKNPEDVEFRTYIEWNKNIWKWEYDVIVEYLMKRLELTNNAFEYYNCLLYLEKHLPLKLRYLPYEESDQHKRAIGIDVKSTRIQSKVQKVNKFSIMR